MVILERTRNECLRESIVGFGHYLCSVWTNVRTVIYCGLASNAIVELAVPRAVWVASYWVLAGLGIEFLVWPFDKVNEYPDQARLISGSWP